MTKSNSTQDAPSLGLLFILLWLAMIFAGAAILCALGGKLVHIWGASLPGDWLAYPAAICVGFLMLFPFMRLIARRR